MTNERNIVKHTKQSLMQVFNEAITAAMTAGQARLDEIKGRVAFTVHNADPITGKAYGPVIGAMHDLCGFAYCQIPKRVLSMRSKAVKELVAERVLSNWDYQGVLVLKLPHIDQGISVNEAMANAASEVLTKHGIDSYVESRLD